MDYNTFQPYLEDLSSYVRMCCPKAKLVIHETWAYEQDSEKLAALNFDDQRKMYDALHEAYDFAARATDAAFIIPSGTMFQKLYEKGLKFHRDKYHATFGIGRYALGLLWYAKLTGNDISNNTFSDFDEPISPEDIETVKACVKSVL